MTATRFCLVRHGETAWNTERRLQGHLDIPLNDTGRAQAAATADALADDRFHALYTSDLARAQDTAQALAARIERPVAQITALRERHYGIFQGLTYDEAMTRHPEICISRWRRKSARLSRAHLAGANANRQPTCWRTRTDRDPRRRARRRASTVLRQVTGRAT